MERSFKLTHNGGNKKRSGLEAESLLTAKHLQKVTPFQIAPHQLCFLLRVMVSCFINQIVKLKNKSKCGIQLTIQIKLK